MQKGHDVTGPADRDGDRAECIFQNQIPADNPREKFAERGIAVRVRAPGHGHQ